MTSSSSSGSTANDGFGHSCSTWQRTRGETRNLAEERLILTGYLTAQLRRRLLESRSRGLEPTEVELDEDLRRSLEALGYL